MLKSSGGKFPDDRVHYVGDIGSEYELHRGIFVEIQIRTSFYNVSQSMRFLKSVIDMSNVIPSFQEDFLGTFVKFTNAVYIHPKSVRPSKDYDSIAFNFTNTLMKRYAEKPKTLNNSMTNLSLMMCSRRRDAYGKILDETELDVFYKFETNEAYNLIGISPVKFKDYKSVKLPLSFKKKMMDSFSYSGLKDGGKKNRVLLENAAYNYDDQAASDAENLEK